MRGDLLGLPQRDPHVARQVRGGGEQLERVVAVGAQDPGRVVEHEIAQAGAGGVAVHAEQAGDDVEVDPPVLVHTDRQGVGGGVRAQRWCAAGDDPLGEDVGLVRGLGAGVEVLEGVDQRGVRVGPEPALRGPDARHPGLAGVRVEPAGGACGEPVQRPVAGGVGVVAGVQPVPQGVDLRCAVQRRGLGFEQRDHGVAQLQQGPQFGGLGGGRAVGLRDPVDELGEPAVGRGGEVARGAVGGLADQRRARRGRRRGGVGQARVHGAGHHHLQGLPQQVGGGPVGRDGEVCVLVLPAADAQAPAHQLRVLDEPAVDPDLVAVDLDQAGLFPRRGVVGRLVVGLAAAEHQQVGDDPGARGALVGVLRQPHRADQVGELRHLAAGGGVDRVEGVAGGQDRDQPAGGGQLQRLEDEVVVDGVAGGVEVLVAQRHLGERDVADDQVERAAGCAGGGEGFGQDLRVGVEVRGDRGGDRFELDPDQLGAGRGGGEEVARPAAGFEHRALGEPEPRHRLPDRRDQAQVGVVGVEGVARGRAQLLGAQQLGQFGAGPCEVRTPLVEGLGDGSPTRPAGQHLLLVGGGPPALGLQRPHHPHRGQVGPDPGHRARWGEVVLAARGEPRRRTIRRRYRHRWGRAIGGGARGRR